MYLKVIGSVFLIFSAAAIGFVKAEELKCRVERMEEMKRMMILLQGELRFCRAVLSEAFENVSERVEEPFSGFLSVMAKMLEQRENGRFEQIFQEQTKILLQEKGFLQEDRHLLDVLQKGLGYLDLTMQTETLNLVIRETEETVQQAKEQLQIKGKLYRTMGVTLGALLTLLII